MNLEGSKDSKSNNNQTSYSDPSGDLTPEKLEELKRIFTDTDANDKKSSNEGSEKKH